jgi:hypothetical protein
MNQLFAVRHRTAAPAARRPLRSRRPVRDPPRRRPAIRPDIVFRRQREIVLVADCKYELAVAGEGKVADYYQVLSYAIALGLRDAALISHVDPADPVDDRGPVVVRGSGTRLHSWPIDLRGDAPAIDRAMAELADRVLYSAARP